MKEVDKEYSEHNVFDQLTTLLEFYKDMSFNTMKLSSQVNATLINLDTAVYTSIFGTLESTTLVLKQGRIIDAYTLLNKYFDVTTINVYSNLYLIENANADGFVQNQIHNWTKGVEKLPELEIMSQYVSASKKLKPIFKLLETDNRYQDIKERCLNHIHFEFYKDLGLNNKNVHSRNRINSLDTFLFDLNSIFTQHFAYLFYLNDHYMMAEDYTDYLDCGQTPIEGSQYWVAPYIQAIFDTVIKVQRMDIAMVIKDRTKMKLQ